MNNESEKKWIGLSEEEKDTQRLIDNDLLFNDAERQVWSLAIEWAEETLRKKNQPTKTTGES